MFATARTILRSLRRRAAASATAPGLVLGLGLGLTLALAGTPAALGQVLDAGPPMDAGPRPPVEFKLTYAAGITDSFTGTVYVVMAAGTPPMNVPRPFGADIIIAAEVTDWKPGEELVVNADTARSAPVDFDAIEPRNYFVQAVMGLVFDAQRPSVIGNVQSRVSPIGAKAFDEMPMELVIDRPVTLRNVRSNPQIDMTERPSKLLSDFHGYPVTIGTTVVVPPGYAIETERVYPSRMWIGQNGADHRAGPGSLGSLEQFDGGNDHVTIIIQVDTLFGHPLFVDSDVTGPWASALITEILPAIEREYRLDPSARYLTGHAAGSLAALQLQLRHPEAFAGTFAVSPFPVDFSHFHGMDLYTAENMYRTADGTPRALGISAAGAPMEPASATWRREDITYSPWGPLRSFEAAFSPDTPDGMPRPLFDRDTGAMDPETVAAWRRFDLVEHVRQNGASLPKSLDGAISIWVGGKDGYRLAPGVEALVAALAEHGIGVDLRLSPDGTHLSVADAEQKKEVYRVIRDRYRAMIAAREASGG